MLWLALYLPDLPLEVFVRGQQTAGAIAVTQRGEGRERIYRCNGPARACGIRADMPLAAALALQGGLRIWPRDVGREEQALQGLAAWAYQFSAQISFDPRCLLLEIGASLRLFGGPRAMLARIARELPRLGYRVQMACAPTPAGASLLARLRPGAWVRQGDELRRAVQDIPLGCFSRDVAARELVRGVGLRSLGECLELPRAELARRVGPGLGAALDRLLGHAPDARSRWQPPAVFSERMDLLGEIEVTSALVFPARRLLLALCGLLRGHGAGAQSLDWRLEHREAPTSEFSLGLLAVSRDPDHMLELLRARIERLTLDAPVVALQLRVSNWLAFEECSGDLFDARPAQQAGLLERLRARLGEQAVQGLALVPDHRPEHAWRLCAPLEQPPAVDPALADGDALDQTDQIAPPWLPPRPLWLLTQPRPLDEQAGTPLYGGPLQLSARAERIEAGWWDGGDMARDYFVALSPAGERLWVYRDRRAGRWYLHGRFD